MRRAVLLTRVDADQRQHEPVSMSTASAHCQLVSAAEAAAASAAGEAGALSPSGGVISALVTAAARCAHTDTDID